MMEKLQASCQEAMHQEKARLEFARDTRAIRIRVGGESCLSLDVDWCSSEYIFLGSFFGPARDLVNSLALTRAPLHESRSDALSLPLSSSMSSASQLWPRHGPAATSATASPACPGPFAGQFGYISQTHGNTNKHLIHLQGKSGNIFCTWSVQVVRTADAIDIGRSHGYSTNVIHAWRNVHEWHKMRAFLDALMPHSGPWMLYSSLFLSRHTVYGYPFSQVATNSVISRESPSK